MRKVLPIKYYLEHFQEFLDYIQGSCAHLLEDEHRQFLLRFDQLEENAQCLVVRTCNRKHAIFNVSTLDYEEIKNCNDHVLTLFERGFVRPICAEELDTLFELMTCVELSTLLKQYGLSQGLSKLKKPELIQLAKVTLPYPVIKDSDVLKQYCIRDFDDILRYLLFLYFGDISSRLNQFSMRDLGVIRTRGRPHEQQPRFDSRDEARSAYFYARQIKDLKNLSNNELIEKANHKHTFPEATGIQAKSLRDDFLLALGNKLSHHDSDLALTILSLSRHAKAQEKWLREAYKLGLKEEVKLKLEEICEHPESDAILTFAEDFLARKYQKKRTSIYTDMLRVGSQTIALDEINLNAVEQGVAAYYNRRGAEAIRTENRPWRALFGLTFWSFLFESNECLPANEFDRRPKVLADNRFYDAFSGRIDTLLNSFTNKDDWAKHITQTAAQAYGQSNCVFRWRNNILDILRHLIDSLPIESLCNVMKRMSQDFQTFGDGFPDIMVTENGRCRFEEIKAPGDHLRKNQLLTIRMLRESGIDVRISKVKWCYDPIQPYSVVDIETTGGKASQHRIIEIGAVKMVDGEEVARWQSLIQPMRHIPQSITRLTGIDNIMVADAPTFADIADSLRNFLQGSVFVAHNVNFDYGFIKQEYARLDQPFSMPKLCTVREMRKARPKLPSYSLANLSKTFNIDMQRHHRALSDAIAASELLKIVNEHRMEQQSLSDSLSA